MTTDRYDDLGDVLDDPALAGLLTELRHLAEGPAPAIGPDLAAVLGGAVPLAPASVRRSRTASAVVIGLVSTGVLAGGISAAAANELPAPVQRVVSRVVSTITPFEIPRPDHHRPPARVPDDGVLDEGVLDDDVPASPEPSERDEDVTSPPSVSPSTPVDTGEDDNAAEDRDEQREGASTGDDDAADDTTPDEDDEASDEEDERRGTQTGDPEDSGEGESDDGDGESDSSD